MTTTAAAPVERGSTSRGAPHLADITASDASLRRFLHGLPGVDQVGAEAARGDARHPLDQDDGQGLGDRPGDLDDRPDHARGRGHAGQGARAVRQGAAARPGRPDRPAGRRGLRLPRHGAASPPRRCAGSGVHVASVATAFPSRPGAARRSSSPTPRDAVRGRRRRDRHGDRPRRVPGRPLPRGLRRDRGRQGRPAATRAPQGDPRDRRAGHLRQRPARLLAGDARRRRLHQDLDRQGRAGGDAAGHAGDARGGARLPRRDRAARSASSRPAASAPRRTRSSTSCWSTRRSATTGSTPTGSASARRACSTTC